MVARLIVVLAAALAVPAFAFADDQKFDITKPKADAKAACVCGPNCPCAPCDCPTGTTMTLVWDGQSWKKTGGVASGPVNCAAQQTYYYSHSYGHGCNGGHASYGCNGGGHGSYGNGYGCAGGHGGGLFGRRGHGGGIFGGGCGLLGRRGGC